MQVEIDAEEDDRVDVDELANHRGGGNQATTRHQDAVVLPLWEQGWDRLEVLGELIHDRREIDQKEVRTRRLAPRPTTLAELSIKVSEERRVDRTRRRPLTPQ